MFSANALSRSRPLPAGRSNMAKQSGESQVIVKWDTATFENYLSVRLEKDQSLRCRSRVLVTKYDFALKGLVRVCGRAAIRWSFRRVECTRCLAKSVAGQGTS